MASSQSPPLPPVPAAIEASVCRRLQDGQVCICPACEAARLRLLHRAGKRARSGSSDEDDTRDGDGGGGGGAPKRPPARAMEEDTTTATADEAETMTVSNLSEQTPPSDRQLQLLPPQPAMDRAGDNEAAAAAAAAAAEDPRLPAMRAACRTILSCIGEDPAREGLRKTPDRWAKALLWATAGYARTPAQVTNGAVFCENHDEMVVVRNIDLHSLCEHHMVPFTGVCHIGYIPDGRILGLSKLARIAELFARRLQVQERLTRQIADAVVAAVAPLGVAVVVECTHLCMVMRGVQKTGAVTTTSSVRGCFESNPKTRAEFFSIIHGGARGAGGRSC